MAANSDVSEHDNTISLTRKLRRSGNSTVLSIPPEILDAADLEASDEVAFAIDEDGNVVLSEDQ